MYIALFYFFFSRLSFQECLFHSSERWKEETEVGWKLVEITCTALDGRRSNHAQGHDLNGKHALSNLVQEQEWVGGLFRLVPP